jgi:hypothetical protein
LTGKRKREKVREEGQKLYASYLKVYHSMLSFGVNSNNSPSKLFFGGDLQQNDEAYSPISRR